MTKKTIKSSRKTMLTRKELNGFNMVNGRTAFERMMFSPQRFMNHSRKGDE
jgi:hypothetical protein